MAMPSYADYVNIISKLLDKFMRYHLDFAEKELSYTYKHQVLILFFTIMQFRKITEFKAQRRWLQTHPADCERLGFAKIPHRTTLSRRYKQSYRLIKAFIRFIGLDAYALGESFHHNLLFEDKSLFKAQGPVWHKSDRDLGQIPENLRRLDTDAAWSKSGYHGWVFGYSLHITCNDSAFPFMLESGPANLSEKQVISRKENWILNTLKPQFFTGDNGYFKAMRIRRWARAGVALITPAFTWVKGRYAQAYHLFIKQSHIKKFFTIRATTVEPLFDLIAKIMGVSGKQKQLRIQTQVNVSTAMAVATLSLQIAMIVNNIWGLPLRNIAYMRSVFS